MAGLGRDWWAVTALFVFYAVIGTRKLSDEILSTKICSVGQSLNTRSFTPIRHDSTDLEALTLNYFAQGEHSVTFQSRAHDESFEDRKLFVRAQP